LLTTPNISQVIQEFVVRNRCGLHVIAHGVPESSSTTINDKISIHKPYISKCLADLSIALPNSAKVFRLGSSDFHRPRPLKICLDSKPEALSIIFSFAAAKRNNQIFPTG